MNSCPKYLWSPNEIRELEQSGDSIRLGLMRDTTYELGREKAKNLFGKFGLLICTVEMKNDNNTKMEVFGKPIDFCYPISDLEWEKFLKDEKNGIFRKPIELWAVDGNKYRAPI
jgi:hypothetical protein